MEGRVGGFSRSPKNIVAQIQPCYKHCKPECDKFKSCSMFFLGILYINPADLGWNPPVSSWIDKRKVQSEKANLTILFDKYIPPCLEALRSR